MKKYFTCTYSFVCFLLITLPSFSQVPEWINHFNASSPAIIETAHNGMVCTSSGVCYVLGSSTDTMLNRTAYLIKYDSDGTQVWMQQIANMSSGHLAMDEFEYVYVTGKTDNISTGADFLTRKYDSAGGLVWSKEYDGPGHEDDIPGSITIDHLQNVYVTGTVQDSSSEGDIATIRYDASGNLLWSNIFDAAGDYPQAGQIAVDENQHCYVVCRSYDEINGSSVLMRIDAAGNLNWLKRYDAGGGHTTFLNIFQDRFIYVVGTSSFYSYESDILCIKYDSSGNQLWASTFDEEWETPFASDNDKEGNIIITGRQAVSFGAQTLLTIKLDSLGNLVWKNEYDGSAEEYDLGSSIAIGSSGNIFVCGESTQGIDENPLLLVLVYNSDGITLDTILFQPSLTEYSQGRSIWLDASDNIYVSGDYGTSNENGFVTIKYNNNSITGISGYQHIGSVISIFPNPASTHLSISFSTSFNIASDVNIRVYDLRGRMQDCELRISNFGFNNSVQLNTEHLPEGFYTLQIIGNKTGRIEVGKFVKAQ